MTYLLAIGDRAYSSWSLRAWLLFDVFGVPVKPRRAQLNTPAFGELLAEFPPACTVPAMQTPDGGVLYDTLAIAEELVTRHPDLPLWPPAAPERGLARSIVAEMHAGYLTLRTDCPMNLRVAYRGFLPSDETLADMARIEVLWQAARTARTAEGPWLFGAYTIADAFFAPIAARMATYGLPVGAAARAYIEAHLADPSFRRWRAMALVDGPDQKKYARPFEQVDWPGPRPIPARASPRSDAVNTACPFSGKPVTHFLETSGRVIGFCNAFCRDKAVADPLAWPAVGHLLQMEDAP
ncbi:MAG: glutathione S-transferase [Pseudomonadota bacterium]